MIPTSFLLTLASHSLPKMLTPLKMTSRAVSSPPIPAARSKWLRTLPVWLLLSLLFTSCRSVRTAVSSNVQQAHVAAVQQSAGAVALADSLFIVVRDSLFVPSLDTAAVALPSCSVPVVRHLSAQIVRRASVVDSAKAVALHGAEHRSQSVTQSVPAAVAPSLPLPSLDVAPLCRVDWFKVLLCLVAIVFLVIKSRQLCAKLQK